MESIHLVSSTDSPEFNHLTHALTHSSLIGLDAEWKPIRTHQSTFPAVSLLQIACQLTGTGADYSSVESPVFLIDLASIHLQSTYQLLKDAFVSPYLLKLGFRFKQDLVYLSSTFCAHGCEPGFDRILQAYTTTCNLDNQGEDESKQNKELGNNLPGGFGDFSIKGTPMQ